MRHLTTWQNRKLTNVSIKRGHTIAVALYFNGKDLDPAFVTKALETTPSKSFRRGEEFIGDTTRKSYKRRQGLWSIESTTDSRDLFDHLNEVMSKIDFDANSIRRIEGVDDAYIDVFMARLSEEDGGGTCEFELNSDQVLALQKLGLPVYFTIAVTGL